MSITVIFGEPGVGKSSYMCAIAKGFFYQGQTLLNESIKFLTKRQEKYGYGTGLTIPNKPPIFSDFKMHFPEDYEQDFETFYVNGFFLSLPDGDRKIMRVAPCSKIFLSEAQRYYDSRKSSTMPSGVARFYEMHRHYGLDIYMDMQRPMLLDKNIREIASKFVEVVSMKHTYSKIGNILSTTWKTRVWTSWAEVERYREKGVKNYTIETLTNYNDIYDCYDSHEYAKDFLPEDPFHYYTHAEALANSAKNELFSFSEPADYRRKVKQDDCA